MLRNIMGCAEAEGTGLVHKAGCVLAEPGAIDQPWHPDGHVTGLYNVFIPLVPVSVENGATEFQPGSQIFYDPDMAITPYWAYDEAEIEPVVPSLALGELLIFDYRITHRGRANRTPSQRPVGYVVYASPGAEDDYSFPTALLFEGKAGEAVGPDGAAGGKPPSASAEASAQGFQPEA